MTEPHIVCTDLVRIFIAQGVEVQALQGLTLRVDPGELTAIVGASGSGKSTLLTILSGLDAPTAGAARVAGHDLLTMSERERVLYRRHTVGFIWQQTSRNLVPYLSAADNLELVLSIGGSPRRQRAARTAELLELVGVSELADRLPAELSGGQQQRVAMAVALANNPTVLLADEPTGELDDDSTADVLEAMRTVNSELGVTTLIVTHDASVSQHVRRTVQIRDGRTATETLRRTAVDGGEVHAEEFAVLDKVGRLQLPQDYVDALGLRERVRLSLQPEHVEVRPGLDPVAPTAPTEEPS
ncbi:ABC transporter ATP-binding protein [Microcella humidisoli]|uniref:ABC transporter ATP-binding protein n=1 Tax=Microcella humidisoli TaxID=2963406 RepID=A0ABY5FTJ1_9MICO|nr:ABC transporter ATP-binding protein [Microcella humidisoli]UTT61598.1 ABC transporter ATP-binding protein [Microcella humidisoli]